MKKNKTQLINLMQFFTVIFILLISITGNCQTKKQNSINTCYLSKNIKKKYGIINSDTLVSMIRKSNDECNLKLVDSLITFFICNPENKAYALLRNLSIYSDGYLTDYVVEKLSRIFDKAFFAFFEYLYIDSKKNIKSNLDKILVECWSNTASLSNDPNMEVKIIKKKAKKEVMKSEKNAGDKMIYLNSLLKKINPNYLD